MVRALPVCRIKMSVQNALLAVTPEFSVLTLTAVTSVDTALLVSEFTSPHSRQK